MAKYRKKSVVIDAIQFEYRDGCDGPLTCDLAETLGLSRNGPSKLWEVLTSKGWRIVEHSFWIVTDPNGEKRVFGPGLFEALFEPVI